MALPPARKPTKEQLDRLLASRGGPLPQGTSAGAIYPGIPPRPLPDVPLFPPGRGSIPDPHVAGPAHRDPRMAREWERLLEFLGLGEVGFEAAGPNAIARIRRYLETEPFEGRKFAPHEIDEILERSAREPKLLRRLIRSTEKFEGRTSPPGGRPLGSPFQERIGPIRWKPYTPLVDPGNIEVPRLPEKPKYGGVRKIISGAQTGADQAGLAAAEELGLERGGMVPLGRRTDVGALTDEDMKRWGLRESTSSAYPPRTAQNVADADATVIFGNENSPGSRLTARLAREKNKPLIVNPTAQELRAFLEANKVQTLNVAGNRERTNPGIFDRTRKTLSEAIRPLPSGPVGVSAARMTGAPSEGMKFMEEVRAIQAKKKPGELVYVEELLDSPRKKWLMGLRDEMRKAKGAAGGLGLAIDPFAVHAPGVRGFLASPTVRGSTAIIPLHTLVKNLPKAPGAGSGISPLEKGPTGAETRMRKGAREQRAGAHLPPEQRTIRVGIERRGGVRGQAMMFPYTYVPPSEVIPGTPTREAGATRYVDPRTGHEVEIRPRFEAPALGRRRREEFRETRREFRRAARARDPEAFRRFTKLLEPASWKVMALYRANLARFRDASKAWNQTAYMIRRGGWLTPEELASLPEGTARDLMGRTFKPATIKGLKRPDVKALKVLGRGGEILTAQQGEQIVRALKRAGVPGLLFAASLGLLAAAED